MANGYADVPTRFRADGALDKAVLMDATADSLTGDRDFDEFVLRTVAGAGNPADAQAQAWAAFVEGLPYRRESDEKYRAWREVVGFGGVAPSGGDCDDLAILTVAGFRVLGLSALIEVLKDEQGWAFHVRTRLGLPPASPTYWAVVDPVWKSEREWAMAGRDLQSSPLVVESEKQLQGQSLQSSFILAQESSTSNWSSLILIAIGLAMGLLWRRSTRKS